jgi:hypothetical protein
LGDEPERRTQGKDVEPVMAASATLVRPTKRLNPLGVVKE